VKTFILNSLSGKRTKKKEKGGLMVVRVKTDDIAKALKLCKAVSDKKAPFTVLSSVLIEPSLEENILYLTATDLEMGCRGRVPAEVEGDFPPFCVPARKLYDIVKHFPEDVLCLIRDGNNLTVKSEDEKIVYNLNTIESNEFPKLPELNEKNTVDIPGKDLAELINNTIFCTAREEIDFVLEGICFEALKDEGKLRAVASDGYRLVIFDREVEGMENFSVDSFIVGRKAAKQIKEMAEEETVVRFGFANNHVVVFTPSFTFYARTIEGAYPDYRSVIPSGSDGVLKVDRRLFMNAVKRVSLVSSGCFKPVTLELTPQEVVLTSQETDTGKAQVKIGAEYTGENMMVTYNADYLLDVLQVMKSEKVEVKVSREKTPAVLTGSEDEGFLYLLMPMVL